MIAESMQAQSDSSIGLGKHKSVHPTPVNSEESCILRVDGVEAKIPILLGTDGSKMLDI